MKTHPISTHATAVQRKRVRIAAIASACLALLATNAHALNGAALGGYGIKNAGMGGAGIALPLDASAAANNPAGMAFVPSSFAVNLVAFQGKTDVTTSNPQLGSVVYNDNTSVAAPEGGINWVLNPEFTIGLTFSGAGAGADYGKSYQWAPGGPTLKAGQKVADLIPNVSWKVTPDLALGLGIIFSGQEFESQGVPTPAGFVGGYGKQTAAGVGARIGALWNANSAVSLGATYKMKTSMGKLGSYSRDILAYSDGVVDIPAEYGLGLAWKASPTVVVAADYLTIQYAGVKVNQDSNGVAWKDQSVIKLGVAWDMNPTWTLRGGMSSNSELFDDAHVTNNILSPAIDRTSYTFGASMKLTPKSDISFSAEINPSLTRTGTRDMMGTLVTIQGQTQVLRLGYQMQF